MGHRIALVAWAAIILVGLARGANAQADTNRVVLKGFGIEFAAPQG